MSRAPAENVARYIDAAELARSQASWEGDFKATRFPRLGEAAAADTPAVSARLQFDQWNGLPAVRGRVSGALELVCQRCLKPYQYYADESFELILAGSAEDLNVVPESHEAVVVDAARLDLHWLVEEQLLLAIPLAPKHEDEAECRSVSVADAVEVSKEKRVAPDKRQRPFANLREQLSRRAKL